MRRSYPPVPRSCSQARRDLRAFLGSRDVDDEATETALLVANELASNAVDHARTPFTLTADLTPGNLHIELADGSADEPRVQPHDPRAARGRGLQLVDSLALRWSVDRHAAGKTVTADLGVATMAAYS